MTRRVLVSFAGAGSGVEELSWGQQSIWQTTVVYGSSRTVAGVDELPPGTTVEDAAETLRFAMSRHQALRTRLRFDGGPLPKQVCAASGEIALEVVDAGDDDPAEVANAVRLRYQTTDFDYEHEWPVRMAVICSHGVATHAVAVYLHLAIDANGLRALMADLAHLRPGWERSAPPVTAMGPMEQAKRQRSPATLRQGAASLRHLQRVLRAAPVSRFGPPRHDGEPEFRQARLRSPAATLAVRAIAARNGIDTSPVLLTMFAVTLARWGGTHPVFVMLLVSNRFRPGLADTVSGITQSSPCLIDVADSTVDEVAVRASHLAMSAYKYAYYNPYERDAMMAAVNEERGEAVDFSCYFNDRRPPESEPPPGPVPTDREIGDAALVRGEMTWEKRAGVPHQKLFLAVDHQDGAVVFNLSADDRFFTLADMEALVRGMESVAVDAALDPALPTGMSSASV